VGGVLQAVVEGVYKDAVQAAVLHRQTVQVVPVAGECDNEFRLNLEKEGYGTAGSLRIHHSCCCCRIRASDCVES